MDLKILGPLTPGSEVSVAENNCFIKIDVNNEIHFFKLLINDEMNVEHLNESELKYVKFTTIISLNEDSPVLILAICKIDLSFDDLSEKVIQYIKNGAIYSNTLEDFIINLFYVIKEHNNFYYLFGFLEEKSKDFQKDDKNIISMLDVLGFSEIVNNNLLDEVENIYKKTIPSLLKSIALYTSVIILKYPLYKVY